MAEMYYDYKKLMLEIDTYMNKYNFLSVTGICKSILGQTVYALTLGEGKCVVTYVGGEEGCDVISPSLLLRFVRDVCSLYEEKGTVFGFSIESILKNYTFLIVPMLNPDGCIYCTEGINDNNPLKERSLKLNNGKSDFSTWKGNARGVELKYNYSLADSEYELEPEVGNLCNFFKYGMTPDILVAFQASDCSDGAVYYGEGESENKIAVALSQMSGLKRNFRENEASKIMLADWAIKELGAAAFSIDLPNFNSGSQKQFDDKSFSLYTKMRKLLFCAPLLNKLR